MTLRFIIGRAGTGKTEYCIETVRKVLTESPMGSPIILLVPEQSTFQMEYALSNTPGLGGIVRAQVLSFRRLAFRVLQETGGASRVTIGELGKRMVLRRLLEKYKDSLLAFARSADKPGFADTLARSIGELKLYQISPHNLRETADKIKGSMGLLPAKLNDLSIIYNDFEDFLRNRFTDPDDSLTIVAERLGLSSLIKDAEVWVDGFTGFTPQEFSVIENLLKYAKRVNVALCLDPADRTKDLTESDLFFPTWETMREISVRAVKAGAALEEYIILEPPLAPRFSLNHSLAHLEKNYFMYPAASLNKHSGIKLAAGVNRRAEIEAAAREIAFLCREKRYRWKDIAVLLREMGPYKDLISGIFQNYGIPFFIDSKRDMLHHPLVELVRSAVESVLKDWSYEPLFRCLKTDLLPISRDESDLLENYVLAHGIRGFARWSGGDWQYLKRYTLGEDAEITDREAADLTVVNGIRAKVVNCLSRFTLEVQESSNVLSVTSAIYQLLEDLGVGDTLFAWAGQAQEAGRLEEVREHLQVWNAVTGLFDEMSEAIGEENLPMDSYLAVLESGLESLSLGLIPPGLDQVVVGTMDRSRNTNIKALFILGATEGVLPARQSDDGLFNDPERQRLEECGVGLAPGGRRKAFDEQYLIYTALTRAREYLWIGFPLSDDEGRALAVSPVIKRIREIIPGLEENLYQMELSLQNLSEDNVEYFAHSGSAVLILAAGLRELRAGREPAPAWWDLYNYHIAAPGGRQKLTNVLKAVFHKNSEEKIPAEVSKKMYGFPVRASVSRIEKFNSCPFAHYASYGLRLKERPLYRLAAPDMGEFFHAALKLFNDRLEANHLDWGGLSPDECAALTGQIVGELTPQLQNEILLSSARYRYLTNKLRRNVNRAVLVLAEHARRSSFRPVGVELSFGPGGTLPSVTVELSGGSKLELVGRIDRVDAGRVGELDYLRVIDYKSSANRLNLDEIFYGLRLQLITYLHVVLSHSAQLIGRPGHPGAVLYFMVKEPMISSPGPLPPELVEKEMLKRLKMQGFLLGDPEVVKNMDDRLQTGWSELLPAALNKDGGFYGSSSVVAREHFEALRCFLQQVFAGSGSAILEGVVSIEPYKYKSVTACDYCPFKPVCQFDLLLGENRFRILKRLTDDQVWTRLIQREVE